MPALEDQPSSQRFDWSYMFSNVQAQVSLKLKRLCFRSQTKYVISPNPSCFCDPSAASMLADAYGGEQAVAKRFGVKYGTYCAAWNTMPDGRPQARTRAFDALIFKRGSVLVDMHQLADV
jgi:hypothetical protein